MNSISQIGTALPINRIPKFGADFPNHSGLYVNVIRVISKAEKLKQIALKNGPEKSAIPVAVANSLDTDGRGVWSLTPLDPNNEQYLQLAKDELEGKAYIG